MAKVRDEDVKNAGKVVSEPNMTYVQENPELRALIDTVSKTRPQEGDSTNGLLLGQYETVFPDFKRSLQRLPSTLRRTPGDRSLDLDDVNEVKIGIEKRFEEETIDNDRGFTRKIDGEQRRRFAENQCKKSSFQLRVVRGGCPTWAQDALSAANVRTCLPTLGRGAVQDNSSMPGTGASLPPLHLGTLRRVKMSKKRTVQGKTTINRTTTRKEEERSMTSPTGEIDCRRNVDESGTTAENTETHEEELVETYDDDDTPL
ncbi:hypothetical protein V5799_031687 [Amblyomma americanum]|uniref:Uncharacterized protein n=1 Tax=Amblyomma americanum TaxID=6943 RepID=A0AAQ4DTB5_AMBAM